MRPPTQSLARCDLPGTQTPQYSGTEHTQEVIEKQVNCTPEGEQGSKPAVGSVHTRPSPTFPFCLTPPPPLPWLLEFCAAPILQGGNRLGLRGCGVGAGLRGYTASPGASECNARKATERVRTLVFSCSLTLWPEQDAGSCFNAELLPLLRRVQSPENPVLSQTLSEKVLCYLGSSSASLTSEGGALTAQRGCAASGAGGQVCSGQAAELGVLALAGRVEGPQHLPRLRHISDSSLGNEETRRICMVLHSSSIFVSMTISAISFP